MPENTYGLQKTHATYATAFFPEQVEEIKGKQCTTFGDVTTGPLQHLWPNWPVL